MDRKSASGLSFESFKLSIGSDCLKEMNEMGITFERAFNMFKEMINDFNLSDDDELGTIEDIMKNVIKEYTEELLYKEFRRYELDWE